MFSFAACAALISLAAIPVARSAQIDVTVGGPGVLKYNPESVNANPGDTVVFTFMQKNHTATQSTLANPCQMAPGGFDSGFVPVADNSTGPFPVAQFTVKDTNPIWVYCRQTGHCQQGMVFAINPGANLAAFQAAATGNSTSSSASATATSAAAATATISKGGQEVTTTYASFPGSAAPTSAVSTDHFIVVGGTNKLFYSPSNITAQVGDTVTFQFQQKNHTVTESSFATPCRSLTSTSTNGQVGFDSGFIPVADNATTFPTYTIQINDTTPIWAYCRQAGHCGQGMVFSVNAIESGPNNFAAFEAKAKQQNGTATSSSGSSPSSTAGAKNSANVVQVGHGAGIAVALTAVVFGLVL